MNLYLFDFDGTISKNDSMISFIRYVVGINFYLKLPRAIKLLLLNKTGYLKTDVFKSEFLKCYLEKFTQSQLEAKAIKFSHYYMKFIKPNALSFLNDIKTSDSNAFIVTASLDIWMKPISDLLGLELLSTRALFKDGHFVGLKGDNCKGHNKVVAIQETIDLNAYSNIYAFGDTKADYPMMSLAHESFYRHF